jgi:hypothetical protein
LFANMSDLSRVSDYLAYAWQHNAPVLMQEVPV